VAKDSSRITDGKLQRLVESWGQNDKKIQTIPTSPHVVWKGIKKNAPRSSKNKLQHNQLSDTTGSSNGTGFCGQMKLKKKSFLAAKPPDGFGVHTDKKYPMPKFKYTAGSLMLWAYLFC